MNSTERTLLASAAIVGSAVIGLGLLVFTKPEYRFERLDYNSNNAAFTVRSDLRNGTRCLMREGYVIRKEDWRDYAKYQAIPLEICR